VVDCGFVKIRTYSGRTGLESLVVVPSSQASCNQRAGRAGRNRPGKCYRLFTEEAFGNLSKQSIPEIQRTNLAPVVLQLKALGIDDVLHFDFISSPPASIYIPPSIIQLQFLIFRCRSNGKGSGTVVCSWGTG
jgi:ATP-dependent RNA helicase DDX35